MVVMGPEVTVDLGLGEGGRSRFIDRVCLTEGSQIQYTDSLERKKFGRNVSEVRYDMEGHWLNAPKDQTGVEESSWMPRPQTPTSAGLHRSELHYRHRPISPALHRSEIQYNIIDQMDETQHVSMRVKPIQDEPPIRDSYPEKFWTGPQDVQRAKELEKQAKLTPTMARKFQNSPSGHLADDKLAQLVGPAKPRESGYSSDFEVYKQQELRQKKASLLSRRGYDGDLSFDFDSDPLMSTRKPRRTGGSLERSDSLKRRSDPSLQRQWEEDIALKLDELGQRYEATQPKSRADEMSRETSRILETMGGEISSKIRSMNQKADEIAATKADEFAVNFHVDLDEDDITQRVNINRASKKVMNALCE